MKEPIRSHSAFIPLSLFVFYFFVAQGQVSAQRIGQPYPPAKSLPTQGNATPNDPRIRGGGDSTTESHRRDKPEDIETTMLRKQRAAELTEDFQRLRAITKEKLLSPSSSSSLDYREVSQIAAEINSRAKRIRSNTALLLKDKKVEKTGYDENDDRIGPMRVELNKAMDSFLGSSVFQTTSGNDSELRAKASRDLDTVIRLSATITKIAKRLARTSI